MSKDNGDKPLPWAILAWPVLWVAGWLADRIYPMYVIDIDLDDEPVPEPLRVLPRARADDVDDRFFKMAARSYGVVIDDEVNS